MSRARRTASVTSTPAFEGSRRSSGSLDGRSTFIGPLWLRTGERGRFRAATSLAMASWRLENRVQAASGVFPGFCGALWGWSSGHERTTVARRLKQKAWLLMWRGEAILAWLRLVTMAINGGGLYEAIFFPKMNKSWYKYHCQDKRTLIY